MTGATCVVGNDYEMELIADKTGHTVDGLLELAQIVVTTLGDKGSRIATTEGTTEIDIVPHARISDPTGAGDAYLAGIAWGLARGAHRLVCDPGLRHPGALVHARGALQGVHRPLRRGSARPRIARGRRRPVAYPR